MKQIYDIDNLATEELEYILKSFAATFNIGLQTLKELLARNYDNKAINSLKQSLSEKGKEAGLPNPDEKILLFQIDGLDSKQTESLFAYMGVEYIANRDMGNKIIMISMYESDVKKMYALMNDIKQGKVSVEEVLNYKKPTNEKEQNKAEEENEKETEQENEKETEQENEKETEEENIEENIEEEDVDEDVKKEEKANSNDDIEEEITGFEGEISETESEISETESEISETESEISETESEISETESEFIFDNNNSIEETGNFDSEIEKTEENIKSENFSEEIMEKDFVEDIQVVDSNYENIKNENTTEEISYNNENVEGISENTDMTSSEIESKPDLQAINEGSFDIQKENNNENIETVLRSNEEFDKTQNIENEKVVKDNDANSVKTFQDNNMNPETEKPIFTPITDLLNEESPVDISHFTDEYNILKEDTINEQNNSNKIERIGNGYDLDSNAEYSYTQNNSSFNLDNNFDENRSSQRNYQTNNANNHGYDAPKPTNRNDVDPTPIPNNANNHGYDAPKPTNRNDVDPTPVPPNRVEGNKIPFRIYETELERTHKGMDYEKAAEVANSPFFSIVQQSKNTATYSGYQDVKKNIIPIEKCMFERSMKKEKEVLRDRLYKSKNSEANKHLNKMLDDKHVDGFFTRDKTGLLKQGIDFTTKESARASEVGVMRFLEQKGLAVKTQSGSKVSWNSSNFMKLYNSKNDDKYNKLSKILKLDDNLTSKQKKELIDHIALITKSNNMRETGRIKSASLKKQTIANLSKKTIRQTATYDGYNDVAKLFRTAKQTYRAGKMMVHATKKVLHKPAQFVNRNVVRPAMSSFETGRRILNKETKLQQFREKQIKRKQDIAFKKDLRVGNDVSKKHMTFQDARHRRKVNRREKRALKKKEWLAKKPNNSLLKRFIVRKDKMSEGIKAIKKVIDGGIIKIFSTIASIKKYLMLAGLIFVAILVLMHVLLSGTAALISIFPFFNYEEENTQDVYASTAGKVVTQLLRMETNWANGLKNIQNNDNINLNSLKYGTDYKDLETYLHSIGLDYDRGTGHGLGADNLFGISNIPDEMRKQITKIDGGIELEYQNSSGGATRTSNIKDILSMCAVYFDHTYELDDFVESARIEGATDASILPQLKKASVGMQDWITTIPITNENSLKPSKIMEQYCAALFALSHQEVFDIEMAVLPTRYMLGENSNIADIDICTDDKGCTIYDGFYYENGRMCIKDNAGNILQYVEQWVCPCDPNFLNVNDANCSYNIDNMDGIIKSYLNHPDCWTVEITTESYNTNYRRIQQTNNQNAFASNYNGNSSNTRAPRTDELLAIIEERRNTFISTLQSMVENSNRYYVRSYGNGRCEIILNTNREERENSEYTWEHVTETIVTLSHNCNGHHIGRYCGGHYKMRITGIVYGFTDEQINAEENHTRLVGKVERGEYVPVSTTTTLIDTNKMNTMQDIFDADSALSRPVVSENWDGWTADNMSLAILKYNQDWEELYGITLASALGGNPLSNTDKELIIEQIREEYPNLSEERWNVIFIALDKVGNMGYSQQHHLCTFNGPCTVNGNGGCIYSDCSGFASNLWNNRFSGQIYSTSTFWSTFNGTRKWSTFNSEDILPGDILLHYENGPGGADDHALIYLGNIKYNGIIKKDWSIDCSTVDGVGNVFLRTRSYYPSCYVIHPDR